MNKIEAKAQSVAGALSIGQLREFIESARSRGGMSKVNPQFTLEQTCEIYKNALEDRADDEIPKGMKYDVFRRRDVPSKDSLIIRNILRDCA